MGEAGDQGEIKEDPQAAITKAQQIIDNPRQKGVVLSKGTDLSLDIHGVIEVIDGMEQISLLNAKKGDVVWWRTASGSSACFLIDEPYKMEDSKLTYGKGTILISRGQEHPLPEQRGEGRVRGATVGSSLKFATIIKGNSLEFDLTEPAKPTKVYTTSSVVDMGVIKSEALNQA